MSDTDWEVLAHDELEPLADNLWRVEGDLPGRMTLRRCMVVARTTAGELVLHSAIAMDEARMAQLEALGRPAWLVVPNGWHRLDAARYKARYPDLKVVCPKRAAKSVGRKVPVDGDYDAFPSLDAEGTVRLEHIDPQRHTEGVLVARSEDGLTLVFGDSLFNLPREKGRFGREKGGPRVTPIGRVMMAFTRSKRPYADLLARYAAGGEVVRLVPGHGAPVTVDATGVLERVAASLR